MAVYVYDISVSEVAGSIGHLAAINASTSPTDTTVTSWINQFSSKVSGILRSKGDTPESYASTATGQLLEMYHTIRGHIIRRVAGEWHSTNRNGDTSLATGRRIEWEGFLAELHKDPQGIGAGSGTGGSTNLTSSNARASGWSRSTAYG